MGYEADEFSLNEKFDDALARSKNVNNPGSNFLKIQMICRMQMPNFAMNYRNYLNFVDSRIEALSTVLPTDGNSTEKSTENQKQFEYSLQEYKSFSAEINKYLNYYTNEQGNLTKTCKPCHKNCQSCMTPDENDCIECKFAYSARVGKCLEKCPEREFLPTLNHTYTYKDHSIEYYRGKVCEKCNENCQSCTGPGNSKQTGCQKCLGGWVENFCFKNELNYQKYLMEVKSTKSQDLSTPLYLENRFYLSAVKAEGLTSTSTNSWSTCERNCTFGCTSKGTNFLSEIDYSINCRCPVLVISKTNILDNFDGKLADSNSDPNPYITNLNPYTLSLSKLSCSKEINKCPKGHFNTTFERFREHGYEVSSDVKAEFDKLLVYNLLGETPYPYNPYLCGACEKGCNDCFGPSGCNHFNLFKEVVCLIPRPLINIFGAQIMKLITPPFPINKYNGPVLILVFLPVIFLMYYYIKRYKQRNKEIAELEMEDLVKPQETNNDVDTNSKLNLIKGVLTRLL